MAPDPLVEAVQRVVAMAEPSENVEAYATRDRETAVRVFDGEVELLTSATSEGIGVRVVAGGRQGFASSGVLGDRALAEVLGEARANAAFASADEHAGLARPDGVAIAELDLWRDATVETPVAAKIGLAVELDRSLRGRDSRVRRVPATDYGDVASEAAIATTEGVVASQRQTLCHLSASVLVGQGDEIRSGTGFSTGRAPDELDAQRAAEDAWTRAVRLLGAHKAPSGEVTVVLDPRVTAVLLAVLASALSGEAVVKGRSMLAGRLGEKVAEGPVTLVDDPTDARALSAATVDGEGIACRRNVLVESGVLRGFVYDARSARMAGMASTGSALRGGYASTPGAGCRALALRAGPSGRDEILALVGQGLYVQSVTGVHSGVNPVSGDFSVAAEGLLVSNGGLGAPVHEVTVASTLPRMLHSVLAVGNDYEWLPGIAAGQTLAISGMRMSGR